MEITKSVLRIMLLVGALHASSAFPQENLTQGDKVYSNLQEGTVVDVNIAIAAARDMLPVFYPGQWKYFTHFILYGLDGEPAAYAVVFLIHDADANSPNASTQQKVVSDKTVFDLEVSIAAAREKILLLSSSIERVGKNNEKSGKEKNQEISALQKQIDSEYAKNVQGTDVYATVITGASDTMPVVLKCHKGLPVAFIRKTEAIDLLNRDVSDEQWQITRFLYLSPFDEAFEAQSTPGSDRNRPVKHCIVDMRTRIVKTIDELREKQAQFESEKVLRKDENPNLVVEEQSWKERNRKQWDVYRQREHDERQKQILPADQTKTPLEHLGHPMTSSKEILNESGVPSHGVKQETLGAVQDDSQRGKKSQSGQKAPLEGIKNGASTAAKEKDRNTSNISSDKSSDSVNEQKGATEQAKSQPDKPLSSTNEEEND